MYLRLAAVAVSLSIVLPLAANAESDPRGEERTFASFPEWYIVYSAQEYAALVEEGMPSAFPYFAATQQYWDSVGYAKGALGTTALDSNTETVLRFIGVSFTLENILIGTYEGTVGRLSELLNFGYKTAEDRYTDGVAREYGEFLNHTPWYAFPYFEKLGGLWQTWGWSSITPRGIERRVIFTVGYGIKGLYGKGMGYLSRSSLGTAELTTSFTVENISLPDLERIPGVSIVASNADGTIEAEAPRYREFTKVADEVANKGGDFVTIEGHDEIMWTIKTVDDAACFRQFPLEGLIFAMPILTQVEHPATRMAVRTPVSDLASQLRIYTSRHWCGIPIEHIYDY